MNPSQLNLTAQFILDREARRDAAGHLVVYDLPSGDGGGKFEVAGINERFDPYEANELRRMIKEGLHAEAENFAVQYYLRNTNAVGKWEAPAAVEAWLRDAAFNRGLAGACKMLQMALNISADGKFGPRTRSALTSQSSDPDALLIKLHAAQIAYEKRVAPPVGPRAKFWKGLNNRWNARLAFCRTLLTDHA